MLKKSRVTKQFIIQPRTLQSVNGEPLLITRDDQIRPRWPQATPGHSLAAQRHGVWRKQKVILGHFPSGMMEIKLFLCKEEEERDMVSNQKRCLLREPPTPFPHQGQSSGKRTWVHNKWESKWAFNRNKAMLRQRWSENHVFISIMIFKLLMYKALFKVLGCIREEILSWLPVRSLWGFTLAALPYPEPQPPHGGDADVSMGSIVWTSMPGRPRGSCRRAKEKHWGWKHLQKGSVPSRAKEVLVQQARDSGVLCSGPRVEPRPTGQGSPTHLHPFICVSF